MPIMPFHLGPGVLIKGIAPASFSLSSFALANAAMDAEPLFRFLASRTPHYGASHSIAGAMLIAIAVGRFGQPVIARAWQLYERSAGNAADAIRITKVQMWAGALLGAGTHLLLDALIHPDVHPLLPLSDSNPVLHVAWTQGVYLGCILSGMAGMLLLLARALRHKPARAVFTTSQPVLNRKKT